MKDNPADWLESRDVTICRISSESDTLRMAIDTFVNEMQIVNRDTLNLDEETRARDMEEMDICIRKAQISVEDNLNRIDDHIGKVYNAYVRFLQYTRPPPPAQDSGCPDNS